MSRFQPDSDDDDCELPPPSKVAKNTHSFASNEAPMEDVDDYSQSDCLEKQQEDDDLEYPEAALEEEEGTKGWLP